MYQPEVGVMVCEKRDRCAVELRNRGYGQKLGFRKNAIQVEAGVYTRQFRRIPATLGPLRLAIASFVNFQLLKESGTPCGAALHREPDT